MSGSQRTTFGIYLGNSSCSLSVHKNDVVDVIANASGERVTPAVVGFLENDVVVGSTAKQGLVRHERCSVAGVLQVLNSVALDKIFFPYGLECNISFDWKPPKFVIKNEGSQRYIHCQEILTHLFNLLRDIASSHSSEDQFPVVMSLPSWLSDSAAMNVLSTANANGFSVIKTISQPAAACLAYDLLDENQTNMNILVFHCGGTSIVASAAEVAGGLLNLKEVSYFHKVSGDTLTSILVQHFASEFYSKYKGNPMENKRSKRKLFNAAENSKHILSTLNSAQVHIDSLWEGVDFCTQLSRARFEGLIGSTLAEFFIPVKEVLERADLRPEDIHKVILTGGSGKIPKLQSMTKEMFKNASLLKRFPGDEVLSVGAAKESSFYSNPTGKRVQQTKNSLLSCLSSSIFIKVRGSKTSHCLFSRGCSTLSRRSLVLECTCGPPCILVVFEKHEEDNSISDVEQALTEIEVDFPSHSFTDDFNGVKMNLQIDCLLKSDGSMVMKLFEPKNRIVKSIVIESGKA